MPKSIYQSVLSVALLSSLFELVSINDVSAQEHPGCFMINSTGQLVNLSVLCLNKAETLKPTLVFTGLQSHLILDGTMAQVRGTVTNISNQIVPLSQIKFQLLADRQILASNTILVETGSGLKPGESLSFDKVIDKSDLGDLPQNTIKVQVTNYQ